MKTALITLALLLILTPTTHAEDWPNYRGPNHNSISNETAWKTFPTNNPKILWRANVGIGYSSITVANNRAYTLGNSVNASDDEIDSIFCFNATTGQLLWRHDYPCNLQPLYYEGGTSSTPTIDGDNLYSFSKFGDLLCLNATTGQVIWSLNVHKDLDFEIPTWSYASSPLILNNQLILNLGSAGASFDKNTGQLLWHNGKGVPSYATPVLATLNNQPTLVIAGAEHLFALQPTDGKILWKHPFTNKHKATAADPLILNNHVFASNAYDGGCILLQISPQNQPTPIYKNRTMRTLMSADILYQNNILGFDEAELKSINFLTSTENWGQKGYGKGSLSMSKDGRLIILTDRGEMIIAQVADQNFKLLSRAQVLPKFMCRTAPTLANSLIYARNANGDLVCIDAR